jgi:hypothetical protein
LSYSPTTPLRRRRYCLRAGAGFLTDTLPITPVHSPEDAVHFVAIATARARAVQLHELGWRDLRVVEILIPLAPGLRPG